MCKPEAILQLEIVRQVDRRRIGDRPVLAAVEGQHRVVDLPEAQLVVLTRKDALDAGGIVSRIAGKHGGPGTGEADIGIQLRTEQQVRAAGDRRSDGSLRPGGYVGVDPLAGDVAFGPRSRAQCLGL